MSLFGFFRRKRRPLLLLAGPLVLLAAGGYHYATTGRYVTTDNAYVRFDILRLSPTVSGQVVAVEVRENQAIAAGTVLFRIDQRAFAIRLQEAEAELASVRNRIVALRAEYQQAEEELIAASENLQFVTREYERQERLRERGVISVQALDRARNALNQARQEERGARQRIANVSAQLGGDPNQPVERHALYLLAKARRDRAQLELEETIVRAPIDAVATNIELQTGEYVSAGRPVFTLVATTDPWVEVNVKETEMTDIRVGQRVRVTVDAYPGRTFRGSVASISPATGSEYSVLPAQNATGNWVKVVQRLPVRVELELPREAPVLRSGMTATARIDTESPGRDASAHQSADGDPAGRPAE